MAKIILRGNMWYSDLRVDGKRVRHALSKFKPEATALLKEMVEIRRAHKRGDIVRDMSWRNFREIYLKESNVDKKMNTFYADRQTFALIDATTQLNKIDQMTPERLGRIRVSLIESKKYSSSTIVRSIRGMITAMRWAEDNKYVAMQNWRIVQKKNIEAKGRVDFYERDAYLHLLPKLEGDWFTSALLMGRAGLRLGELLHLEWTDIQFDHRRILFRSKPHLGWKIKGDKELKKVRIVPMLTSDLRQHLESIRRPSGFVLSSEVSRREDVYGKQLTRALVATRIKTQAGRLGHPHILRHTFASHLAQIGVDLKKVAEWLGHNSIRMTEGYAHLCPPNATSDTEIGEKLGSTLVPVSNSIQSSAALLGTLGPQKTINGLSSKTHRNT